MAALSSYALNLRKIPQVTLILLSSNYTQKAIIPRKNQVQVMGYSSDVIKLEQYYDF